MASSVGWHEGENSYEPFVKYYLGIMMKAYNEFESRKERGTGAFGGACITGVL